MRCSVIICTRNRQSDLERCLESISRQTLLPDEVIIVDGSDTDRLSTISNDQRFSQLILAYKHTDPGLTRQRNVGIKMATGDILFFFDDDVELCKDYIEKIMEAYKRGRLGNVGGAQGIDLNITNSFLQGKKKLFFYRIFFLDRNDRYAKILPSGKVTHLDVAHSIIRRAKDPIRIHCMSGCMMSYHRRVFDEFLFDEQYEGYSHAEDAEFSKRISGKHSLYCIPQAHLFHNKPLSKKAWYETTDFSASSIKCQVDIFRRHLWKNPLNYLALLWSWVGILIWDGMIHPNRDRFIGDLLGIKKEFVNIFRPIDQKAYNASVRR